MELKAETEARARMIVLPERAAAEWPEGVVLGPGLLTISFEGEQQLLERLFLLAHVLAASRTCWIVCLSFGNSAWHFTEPRLRAECRFVGSEIGPSLIRQSQLEEVECTPASRAFEDGSRRWCPLLRHNRVATLLLHRHSYCGDGEAGQHSPLLGTTPANPVADLVARPVHV